MGKRNFFHGTMNASKSAQLLIQAFNLERQGKTVIVFKPEIDTRDKGVVKSRALDEEREAIIVPSDAKGFMYEIIKKKKDEVNFIFADELQFMKSHQVEELAKISIDFDKHVFAYGLLLDYKGYLFEGAKRAIECGFTLHELKIQCDFCNSKATNHLLYINGKVITEGESIYVGDQEYKSVCYPCFQKEFYKNKKQ